MSRTVKVKKELPRPKLSAAQANRLCRRFVPIGDEIFNYMAQLRQAGFSAFDLRKDFTDSFCAPEEVDIHRRHQMEWAKFILGRPWPMRFTEEERAQLYYSPFLRHLRDVVLLQENNGVPFENLGAHFPGGEAAWRAQTDPCERRAVCAEVEDKEAYDSRFNAVLAMQRHQLDREVVRHATGLSKDYAMEKLRRYAFYAAVMVRDAAPLGFIHDKRRSRPDNPIFTKAVTPEWELCLTIENRGMFYWAMHHAGYFSSQLELRARALGGSLSKAESGECLFIPYANPCLDVAYWEFFDLDDLELFIKAHLFLYGLMAPIIETGIRDELGSS